MDLDSVFGEEKREPDLFSNWFDSTATPDSVTVQDFDNYVDEYLVEKNKAEEIELALTTQNKKVMSMSSKLMEYLDIMGKTKHVVAQGTISKIETTSWKPPTGEGREAILEYIRSKGQYDNVMAFNAAKFSSWYKEEKAADASFQLDGVEQGITKYIRFNKAKG